jgi:hypothetical protein
MDDLRHAESLSLRLMQVLLECHRSTQFDPDEITKLLKLAVAAGQIHGYLEVLAEKYSVEEN